jgi:hypothetical protein
LAGLNPEILRWYEIYGALVGWFFNAMDSNEKGMTIHEQLALALLL